MMMVGSLTLQSIDEVVQEITRTHKSLPTRLDLEELEAARALIHNIEKEEKSRMEAINKLRKSPEVPQQLFEILKDMKKKLVMFQSAEQKREPLKLLDLEAFHAQFDDFVDKASKCLSPGSHSSTPADYSSSSASTFSSSFSSSTPPSVMNLDSTMASSSSRLYSDKDTEPGRSSERFTRDDSYVPSKTRTTPSFLADGIGVGGAAGSSKSRIVDSSLRPAIASDQDGDKLSLIKLASLIEVSLKKGTGDLDLKNKLQDQIEWLPESIGKLSSLITLNLSENKIAVLPNSIGSLSSLVRLELQSNRISLLPDSIGNLFSLVHLNVSANLLTLVPGTIGKLGKLEELDLSMNQLGYLPESIGDLVSLKKLKVEHNILEEIPYTIDKCSNLVEFRADYNRLKALPEAAGKLEKLEILIVRYNNIKQLPTTMAHMKSLKEIDVSFNELESIPECLCVCTTLVKMNVAGNFADLRSLPRGLGNLEMLEELNISNNQIRCLPESFGMLSNLRMLSADQNPLVVPPRSIADEGAQAVVRYMNEFASRPNVSQLVRQKKTWASCFCFSQKSE